MASREAEVNIPALQSRIAELEVMLERQRETHSQTYDDFKEELSIARRRYVQQGRRAETAETLVSDLKQQVEQLGNKLHQANNSLGVAFGLLQLFTPDEATFNELGSHPDNERIADWPCELTVGLFRDAYQAVQLISARRAAA